MNGNIIEIRVLDLNENFEQIKEQLNDIVHRFT